MHSPEFICTWLYVSLQKERDLPALVYLYVNNVLVITVDRNVYHDFIMVFCTPVCTHMYSSYCCINGPPNINYMVSLIVLTAYFTFVSFYHYITCQFVINQLSVDK